jgi:hypothetical protein
MKGIAFLLVALLAAFALAIASPDTFTTTNLGK